MRLDVKGIAIGSATLLGVLIMGGYLWKAHRDSKKGSVNSRNLQETSTGRTGMQDNPMQESTSDESSSEEIIHPKGDQQKKDEEIVNTGNIVDAVKTGNEDAGNTGNELPNQTTQSEFNMPISNESSSQSSSQTPVPPASISSKIWDNLIRKPIRFITNAASYIFRNPLSCKTQEVAGDSSESIDSSISPSQNSDFTEDSSVLLTSYENTILADDLNTSNTMASADVPENLLPDEQHHVSTDESSESTISYKSTKILTEEDKSQVSTEDTILSTDLPTLFTQNLVLHANPMLTEDFNESIETERLESSQNSDFTEDSSNLKPVMISKRSALSGYSAENDETSEFSDESKLTKMSGLNLDPMLSEDSSEFSDQPKLIRFSKKLSPNKNAELTEDSSNSNLTELSKKYSRTLVLTENPSDYESAISSPSEIHKTQQDSSDYESAISSLSTTYEIQQDVNEVLKNILDNLSSTENIQSGVKRTTERSSEDEFHSCDEQVE